MPDQSYVLEIAIFTVKEEFVGKMPSIRQGVREALKDFDGLIEYADYSPTDDQRVFADVVKWDTLENAVKAAKAFESGDERFLPYMETIEEVRFMGHFNSE